MRLLRGTTVWMVAVLLFVGVAVWAAPLVAYGGAEQPDVLVAKKGGEEKDAEGGQ